MRSYSLLSDTSEVIVSYLEFTNVSFWENIRVKNFYAIFLLENEADIFINFNDANYTVKGISMLYFYPFQKLKFLSKCSGTVLLFHPNYFCIDIHAKEYGCQGILFQNVYLPTLTQLNGIYECCIKDILSQIKTEIIGKASACYHMVMNLIGVLLVYSLRCSGHLVAAPCSNFIIDKFQLLLEKNFYIQHSPSFYAETLNVSTKDLNYFLKVTFQKSTTKIIHEKLVNKSKSLLFVTQKSIKEISSDLGFEDAFYFSRFFKQHVGISPKSFRENLKSKYICI